MKLRATIVIDTDTHDFKEAAAVQEKLETLCKELSQDHSKVTFDMRERRAVKGRAEGAPGTRAKNVNSDQGSKS